MADKILTLEGAETLYSSLINKIKTVPTDIQTQLNKKVDGGYVSDDGKYLYLTSNGTAVTEGLGPFSGGGGGGTSTTSLTMKNNSKLPDETVWSSRKIAEGTSCNVSFLWMLKEEGEVVSTSTVKLVLKVGDTVVETKTLNQSESGGGYSTYTSPELKGYFTTNKSNTISAVINDPVNNLTKSLSWTVTVQELTLTSTFDSSITYTKDIEFKYVATGEPTKTMYFKLNDTQVGTETVTTSGVAKTFTITKPTSAHGSYKFEAYFTCTIDGNTVTSNVLTYDILFIDEESNVPIIASAYTKTTVDQYNTLDIPYIIYIKGKEKATVNFYIDSEVTTLSVDVAQSLTWNPTMMTYGTKVLKIETSNEGYTVSKSWTLTVNKSTVELEPVSTNLDLYLTARNRSNSEPTTTRSKWQYVVDSTVKTDCVLTGFNWTTNGWLQPTETYSFVENGKTVSGSYPTSVLRLSDEARVTIPFYPFKADDAAKEEWYETTGYTIELEFKTTDIDVEDAVLIKCFDGSMVEGEPDPDAKKPGFVITAKQVFMMSKSARLSSQYKSDEHIRVTFVMSTGNGTATYDSNGSNIIYIYINGIIMGAVQYEPLKSTTTKSDFGQTTRQNITIGSSDATIDIYNIRCYAKDLSRSQAVQNWIGDKQNSVVMLHEHQRNDIYYSDRPTAIDPTKLPSDLPYILIKAPELSTSKTDKKYIEGYYVDPADKGRTDPTTWKSFYFNGNATKGKYTEMVTQGTSSQAYPIKNFKIKFANGFIRPANENDDDPMNWPWTIDTVDYPISDRTSKTYQMNDDAIATKTFVFKADFASSEGCNNVELVKFYNELSLDGNRCPTPPQEDNPDIRKGIDGFPIVMFQQKEDGGNIDFVGKYNFNNHKGTEEVYGLDLHDQQYDDDYEAYDKIERDEDQNWKATAVIESCPTDESWEMCDNNNQIGRWKRAAGTGSEDIAVYTDVISSFTESYTNGLFYDGTSSSYPLLTGAYYYFSNWYKDRTVKTRSYSDPVGTCTEYLREGAYYNGTGTPVTSGTTVTGGYYVPTQPTTGYDWYQYRDKSGITYEYSGPISNFARTYEEGVAYLVIKDEVTITAYHNNSDNLWYKTMTVTEYSYAESDKITSSFVRSYTEGALYQGTGTSQSGVVVTQAYRHGSSFYRVKTGSGVETDRAIVDYSLKDSTGATVTYQKYIYTNPSDPTQGYLDSYKNIINILGLGGAASSTIKDYFADATLGATGRYTSDTHNSYVEYWEEQGYTATEESRLAWIENWKLGEVDTLSASLTTLTAEQKEQRTFLIYAEKREIVNRNTLNSTAIYASPWVDLLGTWGGGESVAHAFEVRYPSEWYDAHTEGKPEIVRYKRLQELQKWVVSTDPDQETGETLASPVTYAGVTYTKDNKDYRLAKFKAEFENYFNKADALLYYVYTEVFLMIDSRVKNSFPTYFVLSDSLGQKQNYLVYSDTSENNYYYATDYDTGLKRVDSDGYYLVLSETAKAAWAIEHPTDTYSSAHEQYYYLIDNTIDAVYQDDKRVRITDTTSANYGKKRLVKESDKSKTEYANYTFERAKLHQDELSDCVPETTDTLKLEEALKDVPRVDGDGNPVIDTTSQKQIIDVGVKCVDEYETESGKWQWLPYDMDTAIGIDNEGKLVFNYDLEDTDYVDTATVYNGQDTVLWNNIRKCFSTEIATMYANLREADQSLETISTNKLSYPEVERRYEEHQSKWPAMVFNDDAFYKYILPLMTSNEDRLEMCQGSKEQQRKWWLFNRFNYLDSKYRAGNCNENNSINFRAYSKGSVKVTPYTSMYSIVKIGEAFESKSRVDAGEELEVKAENITPNDTESYIFNASQLKSVTGMGSFNPDTVDISSANRLQTFDISGSSTSTASNLKSLTIGSNTQLKTFKADYTGLGTGRSTSLDFSGCTGIDTISLKHTSLSSVGLPNGGVLSKLYLPESITNLVINKQTKLTTVEFDDEDEVDLSSLDIVYESDSDIPTRVRTLATSFVDKMSSSSTASTKTIRLSGFNYTFTTALLADNFIRKLNKLGAIGTKYSGTITITGAVPHDFIYYVQKGGVYQLPGQTDAENYPGYADMKFVCGSIEKTITFHNYNQMGSDGKPIEEGESGYQAPLYSYTTSAKSMTYPDGHEGTRADSTVEDGYESVMGSGRPDTQYHFNKTSWAVAKKNATTGVWELHKIEGLLDDLDSSEASPYYLPILHVYQIYDEWKYKTAYFFNYDNSTAASNLLDRQSVATEAWETPVTITYTKTEPQPPTGYKTATFQGWGNIAYDIANYGKTQVTGVTTVDKKVYAIMNWDVSTVSISFKDDFDGTYFVGETFSKSDYEVKATKNTPSTEPIVITVGEDSYTINIGETITSSDDFVKATYSGVGSNNLTIHRALSMVTKSLGVPYYQVGETFDPTDSEVTITYSNMSTTKDVELDEDFMAKHYGHVSSTPITAYTIDDIGDSPYTITLYNITTSGNATVLPASSLNETSWSVINIVSQKGLANQIWSVGDKKLIYLDSTNLVWYRGYYYVRILGFDHNVDFELGSNQHSITFGLATNAVETEEEGVYEPGTTEIVFDTLSFALYSSRTSDCSWYRGCRIRDMLNKSYSVEPTSCGFYGSLPTDLQAVIKEVMKAQADWDYDDEEIVSGGTFTRHCYGQKVKIFLPSLAELKNKSRIANSETQPSNELGYEYYIVNESGERQAVPTTMPINVQYTYFANSTEEGDFVRFGSNNLTLRREYWTRSFERFSIPSSDLFGRVSSINTTGGDDKGGYGAPISDSLGVMPCFVV